MKNPLKLWREHRKEKQEKKNQSNLFHTWALLEKIFQSGQLSFDKNSNRLFMTHPLAALLMANGPDGWVHSVHNISQYIYWHNSQQKWENLFREEELAAVRHALAENPDLNRQDIDRIKRARRSEIALSDMEPPKVEPFEFFIMPDSIKTTVEPMAVGNYDPNTGEMEVATWEEVKSLLQKNTD